MKVLLFIDNLGAGGAQRQIAGLAVMLQQRKYVVKVCTYQKTDFYKPYLDENGVPNEVIPEAANTKKRIGTVWKYLKKEQPDWVISYLETPSLVACLCRFLGCKYKLIVSERNTTQKVGMNERIRFFLYHWADVIVPNCYAQEKWMIEHHPWMEKKLTTITNFVDLDKFAYTEHQRHEIPIIMIAASIWASKNTPGLIEAAKILKDRGVKFKIQWYGKAEKWMDYFNRCNDKIIEYGLQEMVELLPKTQEIHKKYQEADYFCLPSFYEGTPNVICEAMASSLPVICSDVCDNGIYVKNRENGFLFNPHNPEDMADKIEQALKMDDREYGQYCKNSRALAEKLLSENAFIQKYIKIIESL